MPPIAVKPPGSQNQPVGHEDHDHHQDDAKGDDLVLAAGSFEQPVTMRVIPSKAINVGVSFITLPLSF